MDTAIGTGGIGIEGMRLEGSFSTLESVLSTPSLARVRHRAHRILRRREVLKNIDSRFVGGSGHARPDGSSAAYRLALRASGIE